MNAAHQRQLTPALVVIAVLLGAALLLLLSGIGRGARWDAPRPQAPLPPSGSAANLPQPRPLQQFAVVWQKPLFSPDRKPVAHTADGGSSLGDLELTGIILTRNLRMALLHDKNGDTQVRLKEGAALPDGSITLVEVRQRSAVFTAASGRTELKLPAGAPIDAPKKAEPRRGAKPPGAAGDGNAMMRIQADGADNNERSGSGRRPAILPRAQPRQGSGLVPAGNSSAPSAADKLRENIQKRRAARAAAANAGVR